MNCSQPMFVNWTSLEPLGLGLVRGWTTAGERFAFGASAAALILFSAVSNALVIHAVRCHRPLRRSSSNLWLASLAATDILMATAVIPFAAYFNLAGAWSLGRSACKVRKHPSITCRSLNARVLYVLSLLKAFFLSRR